MIAEVDVGFVRFEVGVGFVRFEVEAGFVKYEVDNCENGNADDLIESYSNALVYEIVVVNC